LLWRHTVPAGSGTVLLTGITPASEDDAPASLVGQVFAFDVAARPRVVEIAPDGTLSLVEVATGKVVGKVTGVSRQPDLVEAFGHQLFSVDVSGDRYEVRRWDLTHLAAPPTLLYTSPAGRTPTKLSNCHRTAVCVMDGNYPAGDQGTQVVGIGTGGQRELWRKDVPGTDQLIPVGDNLLVYDMTKAPRSFLFDRTGKELLAAPDQGLLAVRASGKILLLFHHGFYEDRTVDETVTVADGSTGRSAPLGALPHVVNGGCAYTDAYIVCPGPGADGIYDFRIWRYTRH
jgi:hypothetical protein